MLHAEHTREPVETEEQRLDRMVDDVQEHLKLVVAHRDAPTSARDDHAAKVETSRDRLIEEWIRTLDPVLPGQGANGHA